MSTLLSSATPNTHRYQMLDAWRGLSCLLLMAYHATFYMHAPTVSEVLHGRDIWGAGIWLAKHAWVGVPVFFVISGFCIAASVSSLRRKEGKARSFFWSRLRRIYPPLWIGLILSLALWGLAALPGVGEHCQQRPAFQEMSWAQWIGNFTLTESWLPQFLNGGQSLFLLPNTWTLCFEEQFYLLCGLLLAGWRHQFERGVLGLSLLVLATAACWAVFDVTWRGLFFDGHWLLFACGIAVFYAGKDYPISLGWKKAIPWLLLAFSLLSGIMTRVMVDENQRHLAEYGFLAGGFALALLFLRQRDGAMSSWPLSRVLARVGKYSYSLYLTHFPVMTLISAWFAGHGMSSPKQFMLIVLPLSLLVSFPLAAIFYYLVERHFLPGHTVKPTVKRSPLFDWVLSAKPASQKT